ncbi:Hpt domain-containing protein, partial [Vibrio alfacsensis]
MDGFINKPIVVDEMIHTLSEWIDSSKFKHVVDEGADSTNSTVTESNEFGFLKVEGVNLEKGLSISGNKPELFMRLLTNFANQYEDKEIFSDDTEVFQINVHTLKGVAGNLGFESIY